MCRAACRSARGPVHLLVDVHPLGREDRPEGRQDAPDQTSVVGGEVDPIEQVESVATVREDRVGPSQAAEVLSDRVDDVFSGVLLGLGGRTALWTDRVRVDHEEAAADDVRVAPVVLRTIRSRLGIRQCRFALTGLSEK